MKFLLIFAFLCGFKLLQIWGCQNDETSNSKEDKEVVDLKSSQVLSVGPHDVGENKSFKFKFPPFLPPLKQFGTARRRRQHAMTMVLMGIVIFLMFFVTIGFQFLATFGGKAFLMAKLALLLSSINGLKRVAQQGVHYGLYHTPEHPGLLYERFDPR